MSEPVVRESGHEPAVGPAPRILLIEDEPGIVDFVRRGLEASGFRVEDSPDGVEGQARATAERFDAIVLDLLLPRRGGLEVLRTLSAHSPRVPVIVLTARGETATRVEALDAGAIDYLVKPFAVAELAARLRAQLRRTGLESPTSLSVAGIEVDLLTRHVSRQGIAVRLSTTEYELLVYLMRREGEICSREALLAAVWGYRHDPGSNIVDVYVSYLRAKLALPGWRVPVKTVRSRGYRLVE